MKRSNEVAIESQQFGKIMYILVETRGDQY